MSSQSRRGSRSRSHNNNTSINNGNHPSYGRLGGESPGVSVTPGLGLIDSTQLSSTLSHQHHQFMTNTTSDCSGISRNTNDSLLFPQDHNHKNHHHNVVASMDIDPNSPAPPGSMGAGGGLLASQHAQQGRKRRIPRYHHDHDHHHHHHTPEHRHLSLWDLIGLGVGGTVGSGIFVLTGQIAHDYAGPATFVSWAMAGVAASTSALSLCELASKIPATGSTYVYCQVCLHSQTAAVAAAACLTLEYAVSGAAVARTWGDKVVWWISATFVDANATNDQEQEESHQVWQAWLLPFGVNLPALVISALSTILLLLGVSESKLVANVITSLKMVLVLGMIVGGFCLWQGSNFVGSSASGALTSSSFMPYGVSGVLRGATSSFFGYLGYDEVCVVAGEALRPTVDVPRAILGTLAIVTVCYILASLALVGMQHYTDISPTSGFPAAFASHGWHVASQMSAAGELITLPVVVLISLLAQPRLTVRLAEDGVLPMLFARRNADGNLIGGTLLWGVATTVTAAAVPFTYLDDLISCGILVAFCLANSCLIVLRLREEGDQAGGDQPQPHQNGRNHSFSNNSNSMQHWLLAFNALCCISALSWSRMGPSSHYVSYVLATLATLAVFGCYLRISSMLSAACCGNLINAKNKSTGQRRVREAYDTVYNVDDDYGDDADEFRDDDVEPHHSSPLHVFRTPCVPLIPCLGIMINWYLIAQLEWHGLVLLLFYLGGAVGLYRCCGASGISHPHIRKPPGSETAYESVRPHSPTSNTTDSGEKGEGGDGNQGTGAAT